ncbi:putative porin [Chlorobium phaeovibrioides]|uniref:putative porin n=1 Tax=Chlorobium phaeovibrioides TaxID=1094 RepID=UPI001639542C|nr:putative porin [Chlorobium phaeovibrioides]
MKKTAMLIGLAAVLGFSSNAQAVDWNWKGDIRYRYQSQLKDDGVSSTDEHSKDRNRIRVRIGADMWINEELAAGFGLATGSDTDPVSRNETLGDLFNQDGIYLNEAFIDYHPMFLNGDVNLIMGKRYASKTLTVMDDLIWDGDVTLEGITLQYGKDAKGKEKDGLCTNAGYYLYKDADSYTGQVAYILAAQASYKGKVSDLNYQAGASYFDYQSYVDATRDYNIVELFGNVGGKVSSLPWKLYGQYAFNTANHSDYSNITDAKRDAYLVGVKLGKAKNPGQLEGSVEYIRLEKDAVNPFMTDSDRGDLTKISSFLTNVEGFKVGAKYALIQNMDLGVTYFNTGYIDVPVGTSSDWRGHLVQLDAVVKF